MKIKGFLVIFVVGVGIVCLLWWIKSGEEDVVEEVKKFNEAKITLTKVNISNLARVIKSFIAHEGRTPKSLKELKAIHALTASSLDAWGTAIKYERLSDEDFRLISAGEDRAFNTPDDIVSDY